MRISTFQIFNIANRNMADVSQDMIKTQEQMSTGKRVLNPSDDPVASTKIIALTDELASIEQYQKNISIARNNLSLEESVLGSVNNVIQRMQEMAVAAGNTSTLSAAEYGAMATEVGERLDELMNLLNTQNANGDFIFGGYKSTKPPFAGNSLSGYEYVGDSGQQRIAVSKNTTVAATDSGKDLFVDVASEFNTFKTSASEANRASPPASISVGEVIDQQAYDEFYPKDMVISFNADTDIAPPGKNYTIKERESGRVLVQNAPFVQGESIELNGVSFRISGAPASGTAAVFATQNFGSQTVPDFTSDFTAPNQQTFTLSVGKHTETLVLDANVSNLGDLANVLNDPANGNAAKLARLGITATAQGFEHARGENFTIANGSAQISAVMGVDTEAGSTSTNGQKAASGDRFFVDSSSKQDVLSTLSRFKEAMANYGGTAEDKTRIADIVAATLSNLGNAQESVSNVVSKIGARVNTLESTTDLHLDTKMITEDVLSQLRDVDYAEASTRLSAQSLVLQAAQQSFIRVSQLNLFSRL